MKKNVLIGKNCIIDPSVVIGVLAPGQRKNDRTIIGNNAVIRSGTVIYAGTKIGNNMQTGHNSIIRENNDIGDNFSIWSGSVLDYGCKIGNNVKIHTNCYIAQFTKINNDVFLAPGAITMNDPHPGCKFAKECMRGPVLEEGCRIGANATIMPFITVGERSLVGAGSVVTKNVPPYSVVYGNPAKVKKKISTLKCMFGITEKPYPYKRIGKK